MRSRVRARASASAVLLYALLAVPALGGSFDHTVEFSPTDLARTSYAGFDVLALPGCQMTGEMGRPQLPVLPLTLRLPSGTRATSVEVLSAESLELLDRYVPLPAQPPQILPIPGLSLPAPAFAAPDPDIYSGRAPYPEKPAVMLSLGVPGGLPAVGIAVHPLQFMPDRDKIRFFTRIVLRINYEDAAQRATVPRRASAEALVDILTANDGQTARPRRVSEPGTSRLDAAAYEYVVVTASDLAASFEPLVEWKTRKGVPATCVTTGWIHANYTGADAAARIRAFAADAHDTWGTEWLLLGGDTGIVPARRAYAMTSEANMVSYEDEIAADLYYGDLDGDWDGDGDGVFGETEDDVELYPDLFVGRAPVSNPAEADVFVQKVLNSERAVESDFQLDMLMSADILWQTPYTDSGEALDQIDASSVPPRYDPITKLYESAGNESPLSVTGALNAGKSHYLHSGHAWYSCMGAGSGYLFISDVDALTNGDRQPVVYSIGCWPAAFDLTEDCIGERYVLNAGGGAVAFIGNDRYGWAAPGTPGFGYSERFMQEFYRLVFREDVTRLGEALAAAKAAFVPLSQAENVYRWHQYQLNLLGDPEMRLWTDEPVPLTVRHPESLGPLESSFNVSVWTSQGPVPGALVCLMNGDDVYERGLTASDGTIEFDIATTVPESLHVTVTARECIPYESSVGVGVPGTYLGPDALEVDDDGAVNADAKAGPGESADVSLTIRNFGTDTATDVEASITCDDDWVSVVSGLSAFGDVEGGATASGLTPYQIQIAPGCPDGHVAPMALVITSANGRTTWESVVPVTVAAPVVRCSSYSIDDGPGGDGDGTPEPGESIRLMVTATNTGTAEAVSPSALIWTSHPDIIVTDASGNLGNMEPGATASAVFAFDVSPDGEALSFPEFVFETVTADYVESADTLVVAVGSLGFAHDFESGSDGWTHGGEGDLWSLDTGRSHSGSQSWYSGGTATRTYNDNMECSLLSPEFVLGVETELSFWCWYDVTIYGVDGCFVELLTDGAPVDTLDFIGSGGALGALGSIGNDWLEYRYALTGDAGDTMQVRFRFVSDEATVAEGVYIDDVSLATAVGPDGTDVPDEPHQEEKIVELQQNCPNPFTPSTAISYRLAKRGDVLLAVYNVQGRLIRTLVSGPKGPGEHMVLWDGTDELGLDVAAGVYLYRVLLGEHEETRKMILIR